MSETLIKIIKDVCDGTGGVVNANERQHQGTVTEVDRQKHLPAFPALYGVHLSDSDLRIGSKVLLKIFISTSNMALFINFHRFLLFPDTVSDFAGQVDVSYGEQSGIDIVVDGFWNVPVVPMGR